MKCLLTVVLSVLSLTVYCQRDTSFLEQSKKAHFDSLDKNKSVPKTISIAEYNMLKVELQKEEDLNQQLEEQFKEAINQLEEMKGKNTELNEFIDKQKEEITKLKEELAKCKSKKKN